MEDHGVAEFDPKRIATHRLLGYFAGSLLLPIVVLAAVDQFSLYKSPLYEWAIHGPKGFRDYWIVPCVVTAACLWIQGLCEDRMLASLFCLLMVAVSIPVSTFLVSGLSL
jgi:hypothetical protein